ncbi:DUF885 domain-containing protein [Luteimonas sp. RD2P54]|uniref:DUF885 domain-containing protein n=1 Tax=Luteimonas endophytica TaxID=3042023 RepID=A0ABT6J628_9GAMM|nr:DUF885 domain-containing protein [Luteimonas endophytica]MDH5822284.1 DUF885 domain-containing protein [Luteimonas endophytica]
MSAAPPRTAKRWAWAALAACAWAGATTAAAPVPAAEEARLEAFFERAWQRDLRRSPIRQSRLGLREAQDRWDEVGDAPRDAEAAALRSDLATLDGFDDAALGAQAALSRRLYAGFAEDRLERLRWHRHDYLLSQMGGLHSRVPDTLISHHPIRGRADAEAYIARLQRVDGLMAGVVAALERQEAAGIRPPRFVHALVLDAAGNQLRGRPFDDSPRDSPLYADFKGKLAQLDWPQDEKRAVLRRAAEALTGGFRAGYGRLIAHLEAAAERAGEDDGVWRLPDGAAYYASLLRHYTTLPVEAEALHQTGLREVAAIHARMRAIVREVGFEGDLQDFFAHVRTDPRFRYPDSRAGRDAYLADAGRLLEEILARQDELITRIPATPVVIRAVEPWREATSPKAFYRSPQPGSGGPGVFYINLHDMGAAPRYQLPVQLYHEAVPGHHTETMIAHQLEGVPAFRRYASIAAFSEGWSLYAEALPKELGLYRDPYDDFGRLSLALMRAARLVVDTGLHARRWSRARAIGWLDANTPASQYDNRREVERYVVLPGQATAYYAGMLHIRALRERAEARLGPGFDLRGFHDTVLGSGPLPLPLLDEVVDAWIDLQLQQGDPE